MSPRSTASTGSTKRPCSATATYSRLKNGRRPTRLPTQQLTTREGSRKGKPDAGDGVISAAGCCFSIAGAAGVERQCDDDSTRLVRLQRITTEDQIRRIDSMFLPALNRS